MTPATTTTKIITIEINPTMKPVLAILELGHRQLEKSKPEPARSLGTELVTYTVPPDLLRLCLPDNMVDDIKEMEFTYRRAK